MKATNTIHSKAIVSSKGQVVIPRKLREMLGIHAGLELVLNVRKDGVIEMKPSERTIDMFFGRCKRSNESSMSISEMDDAIAKAAMNNET
jgi:AbrB family looped-hinge helix DNA binding protein